MTTLPPSKCVLDSKWIYHIKYKADGTIEHYKDHLVVLGNTQQEGIDYTETFAPVAKMVTVRILLFVASAHNWDVHQMGIHNAFFHGDLTEEVYMRFPPSFRASDPNQVCHFNKFLYGLHQHLIACFPNSQIPFVNVSLFSLMQMIFS